MAAFIGGIASTTLYVRVNLCERTGRMTQNAPSTTNKDHLDSRAKFVRDRYRLVAQFGKTICDISMTLHVCVFKHGMAVVEREVCQRHVRCTGNGEHVVEHKLKGRVRLST